MDELLILFVLIIDFEMMESPRRSVSRGRRSFSRSRSRSPRTSRKAFRDRPAAAETRRAYKSRSRSRS